MKAYKSDLTKYLNNVTFTCLHFFSDHEYVKVNIHTRVV